MPYGRDIVYLYDGSFDGFLTAVFESYYRREIPFAIKKDNNIQKSIFSEYVQIETDAEKAERVSESIYKKISHSAWRNVYYAFLSDTEGKEKLCLLYIIAGYKLGAKIDNYLQTDCVANVLNAVLRVRHEAERYRQFVRFCETESGVYYSEIEPLCDILTLIAPHFLKRLPGMPWMIHDIVRKNCLIYNGKEIYIAKTDSFPEIKFSEEEKNYRKLWKTFYDSIEIKQRHNERCRMNHMPKRYWKYITEMNSL